MISNSKSSSESIFFASGNETLAGQFVLAEKALVPRLLFLHGAGKASKERAMPFAERLATDHQIPSFLFDFSGHGQSSGELSASSLSKRVHEAVDAADFAGLSQPLSICAFSMGGHVAIEMLRLRSIENLFLFYSAVYASETFDIPFGNPDFSAILRTKDSWMNSTVWNIISQFEGNLRVISGQNDQVVPSEIPRRLVSEASKAKSARLIIIPNAPHLLLPVIFDSTALMKQIVDDIVSAMDEI